MASVDKSSLVLKLAILLFSTTVCLGAAEVTVRVFDIGPEISSARKDNFQVSENPVLRYELAPLSEDGELFISRAGLRDRDYSEERPTGTFRIALLGDSIAFGHGVGQSETTPKFLERLLNQNFAYSGHNFEVINFGVTGYNIEQVLETLQSRALKYSPDLIIYAYCLNDPQDYSLEMARLTAAKAASDARNYIPLHLSRLYRLIHYALTRPTWNKDDPQFVALRQNKLAEYYAELHERAMAGRIRQGLDDLRDVSSSQQVPVLLLIVPVLYDLQNYSIKNVHSTLAQASCERSIHVLDLLEFYANYEKAEQRAVGWDSLHPTAAGHAFTAMATLFHILDEGLIPGLKRRDASRILEGAGDAERHARIVRDTTSANDESSADRNSC